MPKIKKADPLGFFSIHLVGKYQKIESGTFCRHLKHFEKISQCRKKIENGDPLVSSGFANARKSFWLKQGFEPATAAKPIILCTKKWYLRGELCGLTRQGLTRELNGFYNRNA